jgi:leucyl aminopeptidase
MAGGPLAEVKADVLVISAWKNSPLGQRAREADRVLGGLASSAVVEGAFKANTHECEWIYPAPIRVRRVLVIGAGVQSDFDKRALRQLASAALRRARSKGAKTVCLALDMPEGLREEDAIESIADGGITGLSEPSLYKDRSEEGEVTTILIWTREDGQGMQECLDRGQKLAATVNFGRWLSEEPGNVMTPVRVAEEAAKMASEYGLQWEILGEDRVRDARMMSLLSVANGSQWPPQVVVLQHNGGGDTPPLGIVGKGVTFDTGGISIKPSQDMHHMKYDMCGAAAVIAAMRGIAHLGINANVIGVAGLVENMPGGRATRPGDVVRAANGKSIEIINTDAEGRLVLADALDLARKLGATRLVDVATLTGAIKIALGTAASGIMGTPQDWVNTVMSASERAGERVWQMPLYDDYKKQLKSNIADLMNTGGRAGGAVTAGMFLRQFVGDTPWAHIDIAGTAWTEKDTTWQTRGATGAMIRTLIELAESGA